MPASLQERAALSADCLRLRLSSSTATTDTYYTIQYKINSPTTTTAYYHFMNGYVLYILA